LDKPDFPCSSTSEIAQLAPITVGLTQNGPITALVCHERSVVSDEIWAKQLLNQPLSEVRIAELTEKLWPRP